MLFEDKYAVFRFENNQKLPDGWEKNKMQIQHFLCEVFELLKKVRRWKLENVQQRTNALSKRLFESQMQFHVRKRFKMTPK